MLSNYIFNRIPQDFVYTASDHARRHASSIPEERLGGTWFVFLICSFCWLRVSRIMALVSVRIPKNIRLTPEFSPVRCVYSSKTRHRKITVIKSCIRSNRPVCVRAWAYSEPSRCVAVSHVEDDFSSLNKT